MILAIISLSASGVALALSVITLARMKKVIRAERASERAAIAAADDDFRRKLTGQVSP
jgi:hypothetical protein